MGITFSCPCGQTLEADDEHVGMEAKCPACGNSITIPSPEKQESKCPRCGKPMDYDALVCIQCGFNRKTGRKLATRGETQKRKRRVGEEVEEIPEESPISASFAKSFAFPLKGAALWMVIFMPAIRLACYFVPLGGIIYFALFYSCLIDILRTAAGGPRYNVEWPDFSDMWSEMVLPALIVFFAGFIVLIMPMGITMTLVSGTAVLSKLAGPSGFKAVLLPGLAGGTIITGLVALFCASYFPMTLTIAAIYRAFGPSLNPVILFGRISRIPKEYTLVVLFVYAVLLISRAMNVGISHIPPSLNLGLVSISLWSLFTPMVQFYFWAVAASRLGFMAYYNKQRLGF